MTLEKFIENINKFAEKHPELLKMDIVYSADDEGNRFEKVIYSPTPGIFKDGEFDSTIVPNKKTNSFCIN